MSDRDKGWCREMRAMNPTWTYKLHGNELLDRYAADPYVKELRAQAEADPKKYAFLVDRLRVLLLRDEGGAYIDTDAHPQRPFDSLPVWDAANIKFVAGMRSPHRKEVALHRGVPIIDNTFLASAPKSRMIRHLDSLWRTDAPVVTGYRIGIAIMEYSDHDTCLVGYRYFYAEQKFPESIVLHDAVNAASWLPDHRRRIVPIS